MHIKRKELTEPVVVTGMNFLGNPSSITFTPHDEPGWWWDTKYHGVIPIDHRIARYKKGRVQLFVPGELLNVWEHLGPLRYAGIDNVVISTDLNDWTPYLTAGQYLEHFKGKISKTGETIPTILVKEEYRYASGDRLLSAVEIKKTKAFLLTISSQWEDLPEVSQILEEDIFSNEAFLNQVFRAKPQGLSHRKSFARVYKIFGWPHMKNVAWKNDFNNPEDASYAWWLHAVQDSLGELSLASHQALPVGSFFRFKTGHREMLKGIQQSFS